MLEDRQTAEDRKRKIRRQTERLSVERLSDGETTKIDRQQNLIAAWFFFLGGKLPLISRSETEDQSETAVRKGRNSSQKGEDLPPPLGFIYLYMTYLYIKHCIYIIFTK